MLKYYVLLFIIVGMALYYAFVSDPCNTLVRTDFSDKYPGHEILRSGAEQGSPNSVHCHVSYRKPEGDQVYEDIWLYEDSGEGWVFSKIVGTREQELEF